jgi:RNA polymerase sigma factor (sigma-70 family)
MTTGANAMTTNLIERRPAGDRLAGGQVSRLVGSAAAGDDRGWDALVDEFGGMMWAVARAHRLSDADAADVSQATWLRLLEHLDDLREPACVGGWLATTARRECLRILNGAGRQIPSSDGMPDQPTDAPQDTALLIAERDAALGRAFESLRPSDQALLRMLMADPGPAYEDISAALDMPIGSIGPTRARALERLRQALGSEDALDLMVA